MSKLSIKLWYLFYLRILVSTLQCLVNGPSYSSLAFLIALIIAILHITIAFYLLIYTLIYSRRQNFQKEIEIKMKSKMYEINERETHTDSMNETTKK